MGVKRPLGEENIPELSFKQPKQLDDFNQKSTYMTHDLPASVPTTESLGELKSYSYELQLNERLGGGETLCASSADKDLKASQMLQRMGDGPGNLSESGQHKQLDDDNHEKLETRDEEHTGNENTTFMQNLQEYTAFSIPWRATQHFEDPYILLLNSSPRKEVPVGPNYQAEFPNRDPSARMQDISASDNIFDNKREQHQMGTCIILMPDSNNSIVDESRVGRGRADCSCPDVGSMRCVQKHVKEEREKLRESIGDETFRELGFYNMGEEVAFNWTADEEQLFHEVVFSNAASHGRDFWEILGFVLPNRRKKEIVSYYFNVFMLRRRAVQNRSDLLNIDSDDDDEKHGSAHGEQYRNISINNWDSNGGDDVNRVHEDFYLVGEEDDKLTDESTDDQYLDGDLVNGDAHPSWMKAGSAVMGPASKMSLGRSVMAIIPPDDVDKRGNFVMSGAKCGNVWEEI
ncbi:hypothetical protein OROGR_014938 [Orobanche gracilis]